MSKLSLARTNINFCTVRIMAIAAGCNPAVPMEHWRFKSFSVHHKSGLSTRALGVRIPPHTPGDYNARDTTQLGIYA